ncbi:MAG: ATP-binding protein [Pseudomonadota bacterium]
MFQAIFLVAALIALSVTFLTIFSADPTRPFAGRMPWLIGINFVLIATLAVILVRRYRSLQRDGAVEGRGRLVRRFLLLFSLSSVIPATIVAVVLGATITQGLDNWFSARIGTIVEQTAELSRENLNAVSAEIEVRAQTIANDIDYPDTARGLRDTPDLFADYLGLQAFGLGFRAAYLVSPDGALLVTANVERPITFIPPTAEALSEAAEGLVGQTLYEQIGYVSATVKLDEIADAFLYVLTEVNPETLARLREAETALSQYRQAEAASGQLQTFFGIGYAQIVTLALLLFGRLGLEAGTQITGPISRLAKAARAVRDGDLTTRVAPPRSGDEIDALATSFNTMTAQLGAQRAALVSARTVAEDRRQFLETLLSEIRAGVIRTDATMMITLANTSAQTLIGKGELQGRMLGDVVPEFQSHAHAVVRDGGDGDASLEISLGQSVRHIRLRTLADSTGGCVLTFDDATRIVTAQRHMAWRDVARRIAHEIRNPLTPIQLSAERLRRRYKDAIPNDDGVFDKSLETITRQVSDIGRMVEEFSNFARMPKPNIEKFNLSAMLNDVAFAQGMTSPDIAVRVDKSDTDIFYQGDERLLNQAFGNLLKNAAEAIASLPHDSDVPGRIEVGIKTIRDTVEITVQDNGPGFPADNKDRLLEPYVTTRERGTGLGLAIVSRVIIDHGGSISLHSRADGLPGARVRVLLPIQHDAESAPDEQMGASVTIKEVV